MAASPILLGVTIEDLSPVPTAWNTHPVVKAGNWSEIAYYQQNLLSGAPFSDQAQHTGLITEKKP